MVMQKKKKALNTANSDPQTEEFYLFLFLFLIYINKD